MARKILLTGTFDILHPGHVKLLEWAKKKFKGKVIVIVARDENVKRIKGKKPVFSEKERKAIIEALKYVDKAVLGDRKDFIKPIVREKPDVIVLGYDQWIGKRELEKKLKELGLNVKIVKAPCFNPRKWKSSKISERFKIL